MPEHCHRSVEVPRGTAPSARAPWQKLNTWPDKLNTCPTKLNTLAWQVNTSDWQGERPLPGGPGCAQPGTRDRRLCVQVVKPLHRLAPRPLAYSNQLGYNRCIAARVPVGPPRARASHPPPPSAPRPWRRPWSGCVQTLRAFLLSLGPPRPDPRHSPPGSPAGPGQPGERPHSYSIPDPPPAGP